MSGSIARSVRRIKDDLHAVVDPRVVLQLCRRSGHVWRDRTLGPVETISLFVVQVLHGNTSCAHVRQLGRFLFTKSAYCEARKRIPVAVFRGLLAAAGAKVAAQAGRVGLWHGHRVIGIDGSSFSMSDTGELHDRFHWKVSELGIEFPVSKFVAVFDMITGALLDLMPATMRDHELTIMQHLVDRLCPDDVMVADRLYAAFGFLGQLINRRVHFVVRVPTGSRTVDFRSHRPHAKHKHWRGPQSVWIQRLGKLDQIVEWIKPSAVPTWMSREEWESMPDRLQVRETRYSVNRKGYRTRKITLVTTLLDPDKYPKSALADVYGLRWQVETNLRHLKTTMRMDVLRCKTVDGIHRELAVFGMVYNAVRLVMLQSAIEQGTSPDSISFIDVLRWIALGCPGEQLPIFIGNPKRSRSPAPRMKRRRHKNYMKMRRAREPQRQTPDEPRVTL